MFDAVGLRSRADAVHIAVDESVADDIDAALRWAAARIEELEGWQSESTDRLLKAGGDWYDQKKRIAALEEALREVYVTACSLSPQVLGPGSRSFVEHILDVSRPDNKNTASAQVKEAEHDD